jgi:hypothetical protein
MFALYLFAQDIGAPKQLQTEVGGPEGRHFARSLNACPFKVVLHEVHRMYQRTFHTHADREVTLRNQIAQGHQLYAHGHIGNQTIAPLRMPIGPNGEVPSEFCPTRYLVRIQTLAVF